MIKWNNLNNPFKTHSQLSTIKLAVDENVGPWHHRNYNLLRRWMDKYKIE